MSNKEYQNKHRYEQVEDWLHTLKGEFNVKQPTLS